MPLEEDPAPTPASKALKAWYATLVQAMRSGVRPDQGVFTQPMPPLAAKAREHDFRAAEWQIRNMAEHIWAQDRDHWSAKAFFSPGNQVHCALLFAGDLVEWDSGAVVWVDGDSVAVPRAVDGGGGSRLDGWGEWLNERYFAVWLGGFYSHPLATIKLTDHGLGDIYGMWVYDTHTRQALSVMPHDDEAWHEPVAEVVGDRLAVYAEPEDVREGRVARWVRL